MRNFRLALSTCLVIGGLATEVAVGADVIVGTNVVGVDVSSDAHQDDLIQQFQQNGVKTVRTALGGHGDRYTTFVIKAYQHGIGCVVITDPYANNTKKHALPADAGAGRPWGLPALSDADPEGFRQYFSAQLAKLEAAGVKITAFELGNELNTPRFNADFRPEQTTGRILSAADMSKSGDAEGSSVAAGYLAYLKIMAVLKDLRDHSKLNQKTPILSGMSADWGTAQHWAPTSHLPDAVSVPDSVEFLRKHGLDDLADGYAVHTYPSRDPKLSSSARAKSLQDRGVLSACRQGTKPCWITEWGFENPSQTCPLDDTERTRVVQSERDAFKQYADQGRLAAILYYSWSGVEPPGWIKVDPNKKAEPMSIYQCHSLSESGKLALSPL
jgi:hypothetical protein